MRWERPAAGREPAAAALLGWLADPQAPRLCLISGSEGCGKSALLAWLVYHGAQDGAPAERAVHAVVPLAGESVRGTVWSLADQLGVVARSPGELVEALRNDRRRTVVVLPDLHSEDVAELVLDLVHQSHLQLIVESRSASPAHRMLAGAGCAELDLDLAQWRDESRFHQWQGSLSQGHDAAAPLSEDAAVDLCDPVAVCQANPWRVTAAYEKESDQDVAELRNAWLRVGQSLCQDRVPASRALTLLTALSDSADPRHVPALSDLASDAAWQWEWSRVRGDLTPPWPGPVTALAMGKGPLADSALVTGHGGTVRVVRVADATVRGRLPLKGAQPHAVAVMAGGTVLLLDDTGRLHADTTWVARPTGSGIARLLNDSPTDSERLMTAVREYFGTSIAAMSGRETEVVALGDATGTVRVFGNVTDSAVLHDAPVNALAAVGIALDEETTVPLIYSGGADGTLRAWAPGHTPMDTPLAQRPCPVIALAAAATDNGPAVVVAWGDGTVEWIHLDSGAQRTFRPGPPVRAVALTHDNRVLIGMDESVVCLTPRPASSRE